MGGADIPRPKSYLEYYDDAIAMLGVCTDKEIKLDNVLFGQLMKDDWDWSDTFSSSNAFYSG